MTRDFPSISHKELVEAYRARRREYVAFGQEDHLEYRKILVWLAENDKEDKHDHKV